MFDPADAWLDELCFPGPTSGEAEVHCSHCDALLTAPVEDSTGMERYRYATCGTPFVVNWAG